MAVSSIAIVLLAAVLHAIWNAFVKASSDRLAILGLISAGHVVMGVLLVSQSPMPNLESWFYIAISTFVHFGYYFLLYHSYRLGDLSHVYPIARGMAPVLVAVGAQFFADQYLQPLAWFGVMVATGGIFMLSGNIIAKKTPTIVIVTAMATGVMIAAYSVADGMGVRVAGTELGYIGWLFIMEILVAGFVFAKLGKKYKNISSKTIMMGIAGGFVSALAYGLVIYVKATEPFGLVSTLRETSVVFATLIGIILLKERPWKLRIIASMVVAAGVIIVGFNI